MVHLLILMDTTSSLSASAWQHGRGLGPHPLTPISKQWRVPGMKGKSSPPSEKLLLYLRTYGEQSQPRYWGRQVQISALLS